MSPLFDRDVPSRPAQTPRYQLRQLSFKLQELANTIPVIEGLVAETELQLHNLKKVQGELFLTDDNAKLKEKLMAAEAKLEALRVAAGVYRRALLEDAYDRDMMDAFDEVFGKDGW